MKVLFVVHDFDTYKSSLLPWRTILEVATGFADMRHQVFVVSLGNRNGEIFANQKIGSVIVISKNSFNFKSIFKTIVAKINPDVIYWPLSWREPKFRIKLVGLLNIPIIGYFTGGVYSLRSCFRAARFISFKALSSYLRETYYQKTRCLKFLYEYNFKKFIFMTDCTAQIAVQSGLLEDDVFVIPPGRTNSSMSTFNNSHSEFLKWLSNSRFFLFMGPPTTIRGLFHLLLAFDLLAKKNNEVRLVCLFRSDGMTNQSKVTRYINNLQCRNRIFTVWRNLSPSDITFFLTKCHAVVMPFLLVPSELPLTIIESIGFAKPVIISESGGTSNFVREFGLVVPPASIKHLTNAMEILLKDDNLYKKLCAVGHSAYIRHPTWTDVAAMWLNVAYATLNISHQKCK